MSQTTTNANQTFRLDPATTMGQVTLGVADLELMARYYQQVIGLTPLERTSQTVELGSGETPLVRLEARPNGKRYPRATGLFHLALLLPTRQDLGLWLKHFVTTQNRMIDGAGDHLVSEALYLSDPEGNGIEIYRDRPRGTWEYNGNEIKMATLAVDLPSLVADAPDVPFTGMPAGTTMGHVHLQVDDASKSIEFYRDVLGFDLMATWSGAGFLSAGGYHHHLGLNTWNSRGATPPPPGSLGLLSYTIALSSQETREALLTHLAALNYPVEQLADNPLVRDPAGNRIVFTVAS